MGPQTHAITAAGAHDCFSCRKMKCSTLLCLSDNASPVLGGGSYSLFFGHFRCKVLIASNDANEAVAKLRLVPTGTKHGEEKVGVLAAMLGWQGRVTSSCGDLEQPQSPPCCLQVCYAGRWQHLLVFGNKNCSAKCNGRGVHVASSLPKKPWGLGSSPDMPLRHVHHPGASLPHLRCAGVSLGAGLSSTLL